MKFARSIAIVLVALLFSGLLEVPTPAQAVDYYVTYTVNQKASKCDSKESWLARTYDQNLPDDVRVIVATWWNGQYASYAEGPGRPGQLTRGGWFIEDVPATLTYPYTFTQYMAYYSPSGAMPTTV